MYVVTFPNSTSSSKSNIYPVLNISIRSQPDVSHCPTPKCHMWQCCCYVTLDSMSEYEGWSHVHICPAWWCTCMMNTTSAACTHTHTHTYTLSTPFHHNKPLMYKHCLPDMTQAEYEYMMHQSMPCPESYSIFACLFIYLSYYMCISLDVYLSLTI